MTRAFVLTVILLTLPFVTGCTEVSAWYHPAITQIRADLPVGTPLVKVNAYLNQQNIDHNYYRSSNQITAYIHNIQRDALVREDLYVVFSFDDDESLRDILAKPVHTQP